MSEPLEIRRDPGPKAWRASGLVALAIIGGLGLALPSLVAAATRDLEMEQQATAVFLAGLGVVALGWGLTRVSNVRRLFSREVILVLSDDGLRVRNGSLADAPGWASLAWPDVVAIDVRPAVLLPPMILERTQVTVLRFVARADVAIRVDSTTPYDAVKGAALGLTPAAASLAMVLSDTSYDRIERVREWVAANRPEVKVVEIPS